MSRPLLLLGILVSSLTIAPLGIAQLVIDTDAIILPLAAGEDGEAVINVNNANQESVDYRVRIIPGDLSEGLQRDDRGGPDEMEYEWRDSNEEDGPNYDWIDLTDENLEGVERVANATDDGFYGMFELGFEFPYYGEVYQEFGIHSNGFATLVSAAAIGFHYPQWERLPNARPGEPANTPPPTLMAAAYLDLNPAAAGDILYWHDDYMAVITWNEVPEWADNQNQNPWTVQLIMNADGLVKYQYYTIGAYDPNNLHIIVGLQNEDRDLGFTVVFNEGDYLEDEMAIAFGPPAAWVNWLDIEPMAGTLEAGANTDLNVDIITGELEAGYYYARILLDFEGGNPDVEIPVVISYGSPVGSLSGIVSDASNDAAIAGAAVNLNEIDYTVLTDENGAFSFDDIPVGAWDLTITADNFNQFDEQGVEVADGEVTNIEIGMLHGRFVLNRESVAEELAPENSVNVTVTATNSGNAAVTFITERRLVGDANAEPWDLRREYNSGQQLNEDRIAGVVFTGENFFVAGAAQDSVHLIYVLHRNGEQQDEFLQYSTSRYGFKDLAFDGETIWGSGEADIIGVDLDGELVARFRGPFNPTTNLAWDEERGVLWCSNVTSNIQAIDREGNLVGQPINRRNLRIYGLAVFPEDPDEHKLYILNNPSADLGSWIHKMDTGNGDTLRVQQVVPGGEPLAESMEITNEYDIYSWVILYNTNRSPNAGGDQVKVIQLDTRKDWMGIQPSEGVIEGGSELEFTVTLDAAGLPEAEFEGEILFTHNGRGGSVVLPLTLNVVGGVQREGSRLVQLVQGWNLISVNVQPAEPDIRTVTRPLVESNQLIMLKDYLGHFYRPQIGYNNVPDWSVAQGYQMKVTEACELEISGMSVAPDDPLQLHPGWQMISYYPRVPVNAVVAVSAIRDNIVILKDGNGLFYLPARNYSNMGDMREGQGYQIRLNADAELVYRVEDRRGMIVDNRGVSPVHFPEVTPTGRDMSLLVEIDRPDGEIGVYSSGLLIGSGVIANGICGIAVRGDDPFTLSKDGAFEGDRLTFHLWDGANEFETVFTPTTGSAEYLTDGVMIGMMANVSRPADFELAGIFPNPFNSTAKVTFRLPEETAVTIELFDQTGRQVMQVLNGRMAGGSHTVAVDGSSLSSGVYFIGISTQDKSLRTKFLLIR